MKKHWNYPVLFFFRGGLRIQEATNFILFNKTDIWRFLSPLPLGYWALATE
jgi:hypothetical protein